MTERRSEIPPLQNAADEQSQALLAQRAAARGRLQRDWLLSVVIAALLLFFIARLLLTQWVSEAVGRWLIISGLALFYELRILKQVIPLMHRPGEKTLQMGLGFGDRLTRASGLGYALLAGFLLVTQPQGPLQWLPPAFGLLGLLAAIAYDIVARDKEMPVGSQHLAREFRALGALVVTVMAIHYGKIDPWFLLIGLMDYLLLFTSSWLGRKRGAIPAAPPAAARRFTQNLYLAAMSLTLLVAVSRVYALALGLLFGLPYFFISLRDWFILTGLIDPKRSQYRQISQGLQRALTGWVALSSRLLAAMAVVTLLADLAFHFGDYATAFGGGLAPGALALLLLLALPGLFLGFRVRWAALMAFFALAVILLVMGPNLVIYVSLALSGLTLILGGSSSIR